MSTSLPRGKAFVFVGLLFSHPNEGVERGPRNEWFPFHPGLSYELPLVPAQLPKSEPSTPHPLDG